MRAQGESSTEDEGVRSFAVTGDAESHLALIVAWSASEPHRIGEVALFPVAGEPRVLGRGDGAASEPRVRFFQQRPGSWEQAPALGGAAISRRQLRVESDGQKLLVENLGRLSLQVNGRGQKRAEVRPGSTLAIGTQLLLTCGRRPVRMPALRSFPPQLARSFGKPDSFGIVGESPAVWALRDAAVSVGQSAGHVLILGDSGAGKELVVRAVHASSDRKHKPIVARSGSTLPGNLVDAELFGNVKDYPTPGMPARPGLLAEADATTLFIDEIGELDGEVQRRLVRVLETGEYYRLGTASPERSDLRFVCTTNRGLDAVCPDLLARIGQRISVPGLNERREDTLLIAGELLRRAVARSSDLRRRFGDPRASLVGRISLELAERLLRWNYGTHIHELESLLLGAIADSAGDTLELTPRLVERLTLVRDPDELGRAEIVEVLERHGGNQSRAWRDLGLSSRYVLIRLMKKHGLAPTRDA